MYFNSPPFWAFCLGVFCVYYLTPRRWRWLSLLGASYVFYGTFGLQVLGVLVLLTSFVYAVTLALDRSRTPRIRRWLLAADIAGPLLALIAFKYVNLLLDALVHVREALLHGETAPHAFNILAPIGISFYVFKLLSYAIDVYYRRTPLERHPGYFALYVAYFPQILAGPIERPSHLLPQLREPACFDARRMVDALRLVGWGLFKKMVVADRLAHYVGQLFLSPAYAGFQLVIGAYFYYFQIYCDFSGYSDISIGISRGLGFSPPANFNYPYLSRSVSDFWTRWHITLSTWLRDYLFLPIVYAVMRRFDGDRWMGISVEGWGYAIGMSVTMLLGGLWHGAAWTFVAWGALHGAYLIGSHASRHRRRRIVRRLGLDRVPRLHHAIAMFITFQAVTLAWILFRATSFANAATYVKYMQLHWPSHGSAYMAFDGIIVLTLLVLEWAQRNQSRLRVFERVPIELKAVGYALFVAVLIAFSVDTTDAFIYFKF